MWVTFYFLSDVLPTSYQRALVFLGRVPFSSCSTYVLFYTRRSFYFPYSVRVKFGRRTFSVSALPNFSRDFIFGTLFNSNSARFVFDMESRFFFWHVVLFPSFSTYILCRCVRTLVRTHTVSLSVSVWLCVCVCWMWWDRYWMKCCSVFM